MQKSIILGIIVARYIALPLIGIFIVEGALRLGFIPADPLYQFVLLLQFAVPPAMNIGISLNQFRGMVSVFLIYLLAYSICMPLKKRHPSV